MRVFRRPSPLLANPYAFDPRKLFVGGLSRYTTESDLRDHFSKFGEIESVSVKMDPYTGISRGFAFMVFTNPKTIDKLLTSGEHYINKRKVSGEFENRCMYICRRYIYLMRIYIYTYIYICVRACVSVPYSRMPRAPLLFHDNFFFPAPSYNPLLPPPPPCEIKRAKAPSRSMRSGGHFWREFSVRRF